MTLLQSLRWPAVLVMFAACYLAHDRQASLQSSLLVALMVGGMAACAHSRLIQWYSLVSLMVGGMGACLAAPTATASFAGYGLITGLITFMTTWFCIAVVFNVLSGLGTLYLHKSPPVADVYQRYSAESLPGISILKPLYGVPSRLEENLETYFQLKYPTFQLVFCTGTEEDKATAVVRKLMSKYPSVDAVLHVGNDDYGINPRVRNMMGGYEHLKNDLFFMIDANIVASDTAILSMVDMARTDPTVGLVHQLPGLFRLRVPGADLAKVYFQCVHARLFLAANLYQEVFRGTSLSLPVTTGMGSLFRKSSLDTLGGLRHFAHVMTEDCEYGVQLDAAGFKVVMARHTAMQNLGEVALDTIYLRLLRWCRTRFNMPACTSSAVEWMVETPWFCAASAACLFAHHVPSLRRWAPAVFVAYTVATWIFNLWVLRRLDASSEVPPGLLKAGSIMPAMTLPEFVRAQFHLDLVLPQILIDAWSNYKMVVWGTRVFCLRQGTGDADFIQERSGVEVMVRTDVKYAMVCGFLFTFASGYFLAYQAFRPALAT